jgi:hypothetical protein
MMGAHDGIFAALAGATDGPRSTATDVAITIERLNIFFII